MYEMENQLLENLAKIRVYGRKAKILSEPVQEPKGFFRETTKSLPILVFHISILF